MKKVYLIKDVIIQEFQTEEHFIKQQIYEKESIPISQIGSNRINIKAIEKLYHIARFSEITEIGRNDTFLAFSDELDKYLIKPINALIYENNNYFKISNELDKIKLSNKTFNSLSLFNKIIYLFKNNKI